MDETQVNLSLQYLRKLLNLRLDYQAFILKLNNAILLHEEIDLFKLPRLMAEEALAVARDLASLTPDQIRLVRQRATFGETRC